jgi:hypothetical protein
MSYVQLKAIFRAIISFKENTLRMHWDDKNSANTVEFRSNQHLSVTMTGPTKFCLHQLAGWPVTGPSFHQLQELGHGKRER